MNDRELLELAAKAYFGADGFEWNSCAGFAGRIQYIPKGCRHYANWLPLDDDGDALRLAVQLSMMVDVDRSECVTRVEYLSSFDERFLEQGHGLDAYAATRRAIVRAAAEIGAAL